MAGYRGLYVCSPKEFSGKTAFCVGLALTLWKEGLKVGYFKPVGLKTAILEGRPIDEDALLMKEALELEDSLEDITPCMVGDRLLEEVARSYPEKVRSSIAESYEKVARGKDIVVVEAPRNTDFSRLVGLNYRFIAEKLRCKSIAVSLFDSDVDVGIILQTSSHMKLEGLDLLGVVFNHVRRHVIERVRGVAKSVLESNGVRVLGVIPRRGELVAPTVADVYARIGGEILVHEDKLDNIVEEIMIGAMTPESALSFFRRAVNKAVVTGGDRADVALAALETNTSVLILTGNLYPDVRVLARAEEKGVPVILVPYDTYTTVELIGSLVGRLKPGEKGKIALAEKLIRENVDWERIIEELRG